MTLLEEYEKQVPLREWERYIQKLPLNKNQRIADLGCSIGAVTRLLAPFVQSVVGIDNDKVLLSEAKKNCPSNCEFIFGDIGKAGTFPEQFFDGIWISYALAYIKEPGEFVRQWTEKLKDGGWFAIVDIDGLFTSHMLETDLYFEKTDAFERESESIGLYNFRIGRKIKSIMEGKGLEVLFEDRNWYDKELNFSGTISENALENWKFRIERMSRLKEYFGTNFDDWAMSFLNSLTKNESRNGVCFIVGRKKKSC